MLALKHVGERVDARHLVPGEGGPARLPSFPISMRVLLVCIRLMIGL